MAKAVYKFTLEDALSQTVNLYRGSVVLSCAMQAGRICLWVLIDLDAPNESREVWIVGTGSNVDPKYLERFDFVGTVLDPTVREVWHVFVEQAPRVITPEELAECRRQDARIDLQQMRQEAPVAATSKDLDRAGKQVDLEREIVELNDQIETLELERNALRAQNLDLDNKAKGLQNENIELGERIKFLQQDQEIRAADQGNLKKAIAHLQQENKSLRESEKKYQDHVLKISQENEVFKNLNEKLESEQVELNERLVALRLDLDSCRLERDRLRELPSARR